MKEEKGFAKAIGSKRGKLLIAILIVIALSVILALVLGKDRNAQPTQGDVQQSPESSVTESTGTESSEPESEPEESIESESVQPEDSEPAAEESQPVEGEPVVDKPADSKPETTKPDKNEPAVLHTVEFRDHDGTLLKAVMVEDGKDAAAPAKPTRKYFTFAGWDKSFDNVTGNLVVTATYTTDRTVISAESVTVDKGTGEVTVNIRIVNNPGILGAVLKVAVDDGMFAFAEGSNTQYPGLNLTAPGSGVTGSPYTFVLDALELSEEDKKDGTLFAVTFAAKAPDAVGRYAVTLSYDKGAIFDENYNDPDVVLENGMITVK